MGILADRVIAQTDMETAGRGRGKRKAISAREKAQGFAFSPMLFYAVCVARELNILEVIASHGAQGIDFNHICSECLIKPYALKLLLDSCVSAEVVDQNNGIFRLSDMGYFVLNDEMTSINMNFVRDICYRAMPYLKDSLENEAPEGLKTLGHWNTLYEGLSSLSDPEKSSWFSFDHYYSDKMFYQALPLVFDRTVDRLLDVGANTGKWALRCLEYNPNMQLVLIDLPGQLAVAKDTIGQRQREARVEYYPMDVVNDGMPEFSPCNVVWMSQFLDCFGPDDIHAILSEIKKALAPGGRLIIVELFADRQEYHAASLSLNATSLYFCCVANGKSRFYQYEEFRSIIQKAGYHLDKTIDLISGHTALVCLDNRRDV